jgi:uncharacterized protein YdeI (YjbR/CyaY-like superfamily)
MAAFKEYGAFGFWKGLLVLGADAVDRSAMGQFGRLASVRDLPSQKRLATLVKKAARLNEDGVRVVRPARSVPRKPVAVPPDLVALLAKNRRARDAFEALAPSHKREYIEWIEEARRDETRQRRLKMAVEQIAQG